MKFYNATPHAVDLYLDDEFVAIPPSGVVVRVAIVREEVDFFSFLDKNVPINVVKTGLTLGLPDYEEDVVVIVSRMVAEAHPERHDLVFPDSIIRDETGKVTGCSAFGSVWRERI